MSAAKPIIVRVRRRFEASAERVFDAWLDPEKARRFLFATPKGEMVRAEIDPRVGGAFNITERRDGQDAEHTGEYLEIDRPRRLVFTLHTGKARPSAASSRIDIVRQGNGCELTLTHEIDPKWVDYKDRTEAGWTMILKVLPWRSFSKHYFSGNAGVADGSGIGV